MKLVQGDEVPLVRGNEYRGGSLHFRRLLDGPPGTPGNFSLVLAGSAGEYYSPRHRHNFEQVRYQLEGTLDFGRTGKMPPGAIGFFPEGSAYGPQTQRAGEEVLTLVLQCGGASGSGYLGRDEVKQGMEALKAQGEFKDGIFRRRVGLPGKRNLDAFQAIWEFRNGRPLIYPKPRYANPILMDPGSFAWVAMAGMPGVEEKLMGVFTERHSETRFLRLAPGARFAARERSLYVVLSGGGTLEGESFRRFTCLHLTAGESARFIARETTELLHLGLPDLAGMAAQPASLAAQAAE